ncbi:MAG: exonuclease domain-containing protein [Chitinophagales bacterium]
MEQLDIFGDSSEEEKGTGAFKLNLKRPVIVFDIESTGINIATDRIVEICAMKVMPSGETITKTLRVNPTIPIPKHVSEIHGIYEEDIKDKPTFAQVAKELSSFFKGCDIAGYNSNRFDVPLLIEEFLRVNIDFKGDTRQFIDVLRIFQKLERRDLTSAYKFYCGKDLTNAHSAEADVIATYEVLLAQLQKYDEIENNVEFLHTFSKDGNFVDSGRRLVLEDNQVMFNFGKHKGKPVEAVLRKEPQYYDWIMRSDFLLDTKQKLTAIKLKMRFK